MKQLEDDSIDLVVTDPPYDMSNNGAGYSKLLQNRALKLAQSINHITDGFNIDEHLREWERILKKFNAFIFCSNKQISELMQWGESNDYSTTLLVWHKTNATPFCNGVWQSNLEYIVHIREKGAVFQGGLKEKSKTFINPAVISEFDHPTVKPLDLIKKYIKIGSNPTDIILDPFMGSGTTANAAIQLDRQFIGYEIEPKYHEIACERVERAKGNFGLFEGL